MATFVFQNEQTTPHFHITSREKVAGSHRSRRRQNTVQGRSLSKELVTVETIVSFGAEDHEDAGKVYMRFQPHTKVYGPSNSSKFVQIVKIFKSRYR